MAKKKLRAEAVARQTVPVPAGSIRVFFLEPTDRDRLSLRRYVDSNREKCPVHGYHDAMVVIAEVPADSISDRLTPAEAKAYDARWPTTCDCGRAFTDEDHWQRFTDRIYRRSDTGAEMTLRDAPPGACWDADWMHGHPIFCGPDGRSLHVKCPDGKEWCIDARASNCTLPNDNIHKCWVRRGRPEDGTLTVDKNGVTCAAGAGSIDTGTYHGFLRNGVFT